MWRRQRNGNGCTEYNIVFSIITLTLTQKLSVLLLFFIIIKNNRCVLCVYMFNVDRVTSKLLLPRRLFSPIFDCFNIYSYQWKSRHRSSFLLFSRNALHIFSSVSSYCSSSLVVDVYFFSLSLSVSLSFCWPVILTPAHTFIQIILLSLHCFFLLFSTKLCLSFHLLV